MRKNDQAANGSQRGNSLGEASLKDGTRWGYPQYYWIHAGVRVFKRDQQIEFLESRGSQSYAGRKVWKLTHSQLAW